MFNEVQYHKEYRANNLEYFRRKTQEWRDRNKYKNKEEYYEFCKNNIEPKFWRENKIFSKEDINFITKNKWKI